LFMPATISPSVLPAIAVNRLSFSQVSEQLGRGEVRKGVEIARPQRRDLRLRVADEAEGDRFELRLFAPVIRVSDELDPVAARPGPEPEWPRADGISAVRLGRTGRDDRGIAPGEIVEEIPRGLLQPNDRRGWIRSLDRLHRREDLLLRVRRGRRPSAIERKLHVGRGEGRAVVELRASLKLERVGESVG
jgi:hypothetical protein